MVVLGVVKGKNNMKNKIMVVGESCSDIHVYCECNRLCPEACVPIANPIKTITNLGMAGNVYKNLYSLSEDNYDIKLLTQKTKITKKRIVDNYSGQLIVRIDENDDCSNELLTKEQFHEFLSYRVLNIKDFVAVVVSSYNKGFLNTSIIEYISNICKENNIPIFVDCKFTLGEWSKNCIVKINEKEYKENLKYNNDPAQFCKTLIVTLGNEGADIYFDNNICHIGTNAVKVYNVSGAGDSHLAGLCLEYLKTNSIIKGVQFANKVASYKVTQVGIEPVKLKDIE